MVQTGIHDVDAAGARVVVRQSGFGRRQAHGTAGGRQQRRPYPIAWDRAVQLTDSPGP